MSNAPRNSRNMRANRLSVPELAKTLVHCHFHGVLSTVATDGGYPYGSVIDYLPLSQGDVVVLLNEQAEHYRYLRTDPRASLLINAHLAEHEAMHIPRVTLLGQARPVEDRTEMVEDYLERHPDAAPYINFEELHFFQLDVSGVRYIAGSGRAIWLEVADYRVARPDPLGEEAPLLVSEINTHHAPELIAIARARQGLDWADSCRVVSLDRYGFDMICHAGTRRRATRVALSDAALTRAAFQHEFRQLTSASGG